MKVIIDIPTEYYETLKNMEFMSCGRGNGKTFWSTIVCSVKFGKPFSKVFLDMKSEIKALHDSHMINFVSADGAVDTCLEIIDKHLGKESE